MKMNEVSTTPKSKSKTDWDKLRKMTNKEIAEAANSDPDAPLYSKEKLKSMGFKRVNPIQEVDVKFIRGKLEMSQEEFAQIFGFNKRTLEGWEQNRRKPMGAAKLFLKLIEINPEAVAQALEKLQNIEERSCNLVKEIDALPKKLLWKTPSFKSQRKDSARPPKKNLKNPNTNEDIYKSLKD
ncbi:Putative merR family bacterial regulatory protein [Legionella busanensis]|uniref:MerR family bacterial regulatory protein n=1 Tax=Legionella busanensis TaxID=190655 RepID=A0A378KDE6_9GAMM|nr:hypothetical protein [Legionella busanensis]STX81541.1 Putative merR family bacterial regulatory protein [Legionella busanensis]